MNRLVLLVLLVLVGSLSTLGPRVARAQVANPVAPTQAASFGLGFDHGGVLEAGYRRPVPRLEGGSAHVRLQLPSVPGLGEGGLELGLTTGRVGAAGWGATATLATTVRWVDGALLGLGQGGVVVGGTAGYFRSRGLAAIELGWDHSLVTYARPTATYRRLIYGGAPSGVHGGGGGTLRAGLVGNLAVSRRFELALRAGYITTEALNRPPGMPFYALVGGSVRF